MRETSIFAQMNNQFSRGIIDFNHYYVVMCKKSIFAQKNNQFSSGIISTITSLLSMADTRLSLTLKGQSHKI